MALVYKHIDPLGKTFYTGIADDITEACTLQNRSKEWNSIAESFCYKFKTQIVKNDISWTEAVEIKKALDFMLENLTNI